MYGNYYYLLSAHMSMSIGLLVYVIKIKICRQPGDEEDELLRSSAFKRILHHLIFFISISYIVEDMSERIISTTTIIGNQSAAMNPTKTPKVDDFTMTSHYVDYILVKLGLKLPNFITLLYLYNSQNYLINLETVKLYGLVFVFKHLSLFIVINLGKLLKKRRNQINEEKNEMIERAKNYVIEDFMENHHVTMQNLTDPNTEKQIKVCLKLLEKCNYDYELYKLEKQNHKVDKMNEKISFLNDIKKLKSQISEKNEKIKRKETNSNDTSEKPTENSKKQKENGENCDKDKDDKEKSARSEQKTNSNNSSSGEDLTSDYFIQPHYFYFIVHTILIGFLSLKYLFTPFLCLLGSTLPSKSWFSKNSGVYWVIYLFLVSCTLNYPGIRVR